MNQYHKDIEGLNEISSVNFENIFTMHKDGDYHFYNILKTINFSKDLKDEFYYNYRVRSNVAYTTLSFKFYNTINLWWLIVLLNNINNPVEFIKPGTVLKVLKQQYVSGLLNTIKDQLQ